MRKAESWRSIYFQFLIVLLPGGFIAFHRLYRWLDSVDEKTIPGCSCPAFGFETPYQLQTHDITTTVSSDETVCVKLDGLYFKKSGAIPDEIKDIPTHICGPAPLTIGMACDPSVAAFVVDGAVYRLGSFQSGKNVTKLPVGWGQVRTTSAALQKAEGIRCQPLPMADEHTALLTDPRGTQVAFDLIDGGYAVAQR